MIWYQVDNNKPTDVKSERIDDYAVSYAGDREYPTRLLNQLNKHRNIRSH